MIKISQFGSLTGAQQTVFLAEQASESQAITMAGFVGGVGAISEYMLSISTKSSFEDISEGALTVVTPDIVEIPGDESGELEHVFPQTFRTIQGVGQIGVGRATVKASNEDDTFFSGGKSQIEQNADIRIWAGFGGLNIPIFSGIVESIEPLPGEDVVELRCSDRLGLMDDIVVSGSQGSNNTFKLMIEDFISTVGGDSNIGSTDETTEVLSAPSFDPQRMIRILEKLCLGLFYVTWFDETGVLQAAEREYCDSTTWVFDDSNVGRKPRLLSSNPVINKVEVEYAENFIASYDDQASIDAYQLRSRYYRLGHLNSVTVSSLLAGWKSETLDNALEGFEITSSASGGIIDTIAVRLKGTGASGAIVAKVYSDDGGSPSAPNAVVATSETRQADDINTNGFGWFYFYIKGGYTYAVSTTYWVIVDTTSVSGTVEARISGAAATAMHVYDDSGWTTQDNRQMVHDIRGSVAAGRLAEDKVRFYREPHERIELPAPAVPQLQIKDAVLVDIQNPIEIKGRFTITGRKHILDETGYETVDILELI